MQDNQAVRQFQIEGMTCGHAARMCKSGAERCGRFRRPGQFIDQPFNLPGQL